MIRFFLAFLCRIESTMDGPAVMKPGIKPPAVPSLVEALRVWIPKLSAADARLLGTVRLVSPPDASPS